MTPCVPPGWRLQHHLSLNSTQDVAIAAGEAGDPGRLAVLADLQIAGRGRSGRVWVAPAGNLNLSVLLGAAGRSEPGRWALLAGLAVLAALAPYAGGAELQLKWPNDVLLEGGKLAGILIDSAMGPDGKVAWVVIGIGANLAAAPQIAGRAVANLPAPAPDVAANILAALDHREGWEMDRLVAAWLAAAHPIGTMLDVQTPQGRLTAAFAGLTPQGALLLKDQEKPITSGEVFPHQKKTGGLGGKALLPQLLPCS